MCEVSLVFCGVETGSATRPEVLHLGATERDSASTQIKLLQGPFEASATEMLEGLDLM
jgi:hypothetical protein